MNDILLILSALGVLNSFILIIYSLSTKRGSKITNILFAGLVFALTIRVWKSILLTFAENLHDFILNLGLSGFIAVGPLFMLFVKSATSKNYKFSKKDFAHILPAILFVSLWWLVVDFRDNNYLFFQLIYRMILLHYVIYVFYTIKLIGHLGEDHKFLAKQFYFISAFLLTIWFTYLLSAVSDSPYLGGAIVYSGFVYFSLILFMNKGYIINFYPSKKYEKTGLIKEENERYFSEIKQLMEVDFLYRNNTLSLSNLAEKLNTSTHILSQVINENMNKSFYELLSYYRIKEAKTQLSDQSVDLNISEIAFEVGYNSLSAFNNAFKKETGLTPSQFRNGKNGE